MSGDADPTKTQSEEEGWGQALAEFHFGMSVRRGETDRVFTCC